MTLRSPDPVLPRLRSRTHRVALALTGLGLMAALATGCASTPPIQQGWQAARVDHDSGSPPPIPSAPVRAAPAFASPSGPVSAGLSDGARVPKVRGVYKVGKPYEINGVVYVPAEDPRYDRTGMASWYGTDFHGKQTANGEIYDMNALSAAHPTLPLPSYAYVTNLRNGRTILVRINDRGPYRHGRIIDLSRAVSRALAFEGQGVTEVRVRYAGPAPIEPNDTRERQYLAAQVGRVARPPYGLGLSQVR